MTGTRLCGYSSATQTTSLTKTACKVILSHSLSLQESTEQETAFTTVGAMSNNSLQPRPQNDPVTLYAEIRMKATRKVQQK